jgi:hypothetical protein
LCVLDATVSGTCTGNRLESIDQPLDALMLVSFSLLNSIAYRSSQLFFPVQGVVETKFQWVEEGAEMSHHTETKTKCFEEKQKKAETPPGFNFPIVQTCMLSAKSSSIDLLDLPKDY